MRRAYLPAAVGAVPVIHHLPVVAEELHIDPAPPRTGEDALYAKVEPVGLIPDQRVLSEAVQLLACAEHCRIGKVVGVSRFETTGEDHLTSLEDGDIGTELGVGDYVMVYREPEVAHDDHASSNSKVS